MSGNESASKQRDSLSDTERDTERETQRERERDTERERERERERGREAERQGGRHGGREGAQHGGRQVRRQLTEGRDLARALRASAASAPEQPLDVEADALVAMPFVVLMITYVKTR